MRSATLLALLPLLPLSLSAPLPSPPHTPAKRLLGLGGSSGPLDILDPITAPLDGVLDPVLQPITGALDPITAPLTGGGEGGAGGLLGSLTGPISGLLDPVLDLVGDALDLLVPTTLICADVGADGLGRVDVSVCACVGLQDGGLWVASDAGVDVNLPNLRSGLANKVSPRRLFRMRLYEGCG